MTLQDPTIPKDYQNGKVLFEENLDLWRLAVESQFATVNLNFTQLRKDCFITGYTYDNDGNNNLAISLEEQINRIVSGATPITGTSSDTFTINTDGNAATLTTVGLTDSRIFTFPDCDGTFVMEDCTQTLTNKTLTDPTIDDGAAGAGFVNANHDHSNAANGGILGPGSLDLTQNFTWTGVHTFDSGNLQLDDTGGDHQYIFTAGGDLAADRTVTLPLLTGNDTFVFNDFAATLTNKTINTASNTITVVEADISDLQSYLLNVVEDTTPQLGGDLDLNGFNIDFPTTANISDVIDDDTMATASATKLATSESIKAYVDGKDTEFSGTAKAWVKYTLANPTPTVHDSYNVTSVAYVSNNEATVTWDNDFSDADYACVASLSGGGGQPEVEVSGYAAGSISIIETTGYLGEIASVIAIGTLA